jgi:tetratricopeptide (TPR) repeat protein
LAQNHVKAAIVPLTRAVQLNPLPEYRWTLSEALRAAGRIEEADSMVAQLRQRGALEDRRTFALYLATTGQDVDTAVRLAEEELAERQDVFTLDTLAWALYAAKRCQEALAFSRRALAAGTQEVRLFYHAGVIAAAAGQHDEATRWLTKAVTLQHMLLPSERQRLALIPTALPASAIPLAAHPRDDQGQPRIQAERR